MYCDNLITDNYKYQYISSAYCMPTRDFKDFICIGSFILHMDILRLSVVALII